MKNKRVLCCLKPYKNLTGSEIYYYEIGKTLVRRGCDVKIAASERADGKLKELAEREGYPTLSKAVDIYSIREIDSYDIVIASHYSILEYLCKLKDKTKSKTPIISINHHEYYPDEKPYISNAINQYIGIRPKICEELQDTYKLKNVKLVWNPFDFNRFKPKPLKQFDENKEGNTILYCGTIDHVRIRSMIDIAEMCMAKKWKMLLIGEDLWGFGKQLLQRYDCIQYEQSTNNIEDYIMMSDATAGVFLGRTTIEGWLCGIPGYVYILRENNTIINRTLENPPSDMDKFNEENVINEILKDFE